MRDSREKGAGMQDQNLPFQTLILLSLVSLNSAEIIEASQQLPVIYRLHSCRTNIKKFTIFLPRIKNLDLPPCVYCKLVKSTKY